MFYQDIAIIMKKGPLKFIMNVGLLHVLEISSWPIVFSQRVTISLEFYQDMEINK